MQSIATTADIRMCRLSSSTSLVMWDAGPGEILGVNLERLDNNVGTVLRHFLQYAKNNHPLLAQSKGKKHSTGAARGESGGARSQAKDCASSPPATTTGAATATPTATTTATSECCSGSGDGSACCSSDTATATTKGTTKPQLFRGDEESVTEGTENTEILLGWDPLSVAKVPGKLLRAVEAGYTPMSSTLVETSSSLGSTRTFHVHSTPSIHADLSPATENAPLL